MKKIIILDGNENDVAELSKKIGDDYELSTFSYFDFNNLALSTVITIANILDSTDPYSSGRALRIAVCARDIAKNLGWSEKACQNIYFVSLLHDIGMLTVSEIIRNKPGRLDQFELDEIRKHSQKGAEMLRDIDVVNNLFDGILYHHERWDGAGYPKGLAGEDIPIVARVIAIADAYDAMSSDRVYRSRMSTDKIISEFLRCKGSQFDPDISDVFIFMLKDGYSVDPKIEQTKAAQQSFGKFFDAEKDTASNDYEESDALTGLFTRSYLNTRVSNMIFSERSGALMVIDIVGLKEAALSGGESLRDDVLLKCSETLRSLFREEDIVCRIDDDRFAVYVSGDSGKQIVEKKAGLITEMISSKEEFEKYKGKLTVAIGIAMCQEDGLTFEELYSSALSALSDAKSAGSDTYRFKEA